MEKVRQLLALRLQQKETEMKEELQRTKHYRPSPADKPSQFSIADTNPGSTQDGCDGSERHCGGGVSSSFTSCRHVRRR